MAVLMGELYGALKEAGVAEEKAQKAAVEVAAYENRLARVEADLNLLKWMVGVSLGLSVLIIGILPRAH